MQKFCLGVADRLDDGDGHDHDYSGKDQANADVGKYRLPVVTLEQKSSGVSDLVSEVENAHLDISPHVVYHHNQTDTGRTVADRGEVEIQHPLSASPLILRFRGGKRALPEAPAIVRLRCS